MHGVLGYLLGAVLLLYLLHYALPRQPSLRHAQGRLVLRPPLPLLLGLSTPALISLLTAVYVMALLLSLRLLVGAWLVGALVLWLGWRLWRRWHAACVVFDRPANAIRHGPLRIAEAGHASAVQVTGEADPALRLYLSGSATGPTDWPVPGVDSSHAPEVGRAIAEYLDVPLVTRLP